MNISLHIVLDRLACYRLENHVEQPSSKRFRRVELLPGNLREMQENRLYLCRLSQVISRPRSERKNAVFLCLRDRISDAGESEEVMGGLVVVNENISFESLFSYVQNIFCEIETWLLDVQDAVIKNKSLQDILDLSEGILQNYVQITDSSFNLLAYTRSIECDEEITVQARRHGYHPESTVKLFRKYHRLELWEKTTDILVNDDRDMCRYPLISKIFRFSNTYFAHAVMTCNNFPATPGMIELFGMFMEIVSVYVEQDWKNTNSCHHIYDPFLIDLYEGNLNRKDVAEERARHVGIALNGVFCLSLTSLEESGKYATGKVAQEISVVRPGDKVTLWRGRIVVLSILSPKDFVSQLAKTKNELENIMQKYDMRCGMSAVFEELLCAPHAIEQAMQALSCSGRTPGADLLPVIEGGINGLQQRAVSFEDSFFYILLGGTPKNKEIWRGSVYYEALKKLEQYDRQHNVNNFHLLYVYLVCESRPTETGNLLHMSRNNVVYRIERIENLLNMDLKSASVRFKLMISYVLMQYYGLD